MAIFLYTVLFMIGALVGSFCTLAVYRIPLGKDITHERSFCPNCNHKLNFLDLIPILSYIFLRGKCRYCGNKIRARYIIIEVLAGLSAVLLGASFNFKMLEASKLIFLILGILYITGLVIISGIDKENKKVQKSVLIYNWVVTLAYIIYLFVVGCTNINRYAIYLFFMFALTIVYLLDIKQKRQIPIALFISVINIIALLIQNLVIYYYFI